MTKNTKKTSKEVASLAARILQDESASATAKKLAASALSQSSTSNQTGADMEDLAATVLNSTKYNEDTKTLAGSVLAQSNKER